jgi:hypothetical protein
MDILNILVTVGVAAVLAAFIYIGRKLQILDDLKASNEKIKQNLKVVGDHLTKHDTHFDPSELKTFSPYQLTDEGRALIDNLGFDNVFNKNKDDFFGFIDREDPKLKYDVEKSAIKSMLILSDKEYMNFLKVFFYNNPKRNLGNISPTLGVYVRDAYLKEHPEITE